MKKVTCTCLLTISFFFFVNEAFCQKAAKENFLRIANSYLEYSAKRYSLDSNKIVFFFAAGSYKSDSVFLDMTFDSVKFDYEYLNVYKLKKFRALIFEGGDRYTNILKKIFKQTAYENLNKGKEDGNRSEGFQRWYVNMNNNYEVSTIDAIGPKKEILQFLKKNKVRFSKNFTFK